MGYLGSHKNIGHQVQNLLNELHSWTLSLFGTKDFLEESLSIETPRLCK